MSAISPTSATSGTSGTSSSSSSSSAVNDTMIASNFTTFLQLLTTQLKNQDPLSPMDTNQFTQQLVQFAQVEQQMKSNDQLASLVSMEQSAQQTTALAYVGSTVVVDGSTGQLSASSGATWTFNTSKPATATVTIRDSTGQTAYTGSFAVNPGDQKFSWDGKGNDGKAWPAGNYTMSVTAVDANKQTVAISTEVQGLVDSVDLTKSPPVLSVNGGSYTMDKIKRIVVPNSTGSSS